MILDRLIRTKILFDVNDKKHINIYKSFLSTGAWGKTGCPFILEFPYLSVPDMAKDKIIHNYLGVKKHV
jgi:hypothetical protein